MKKIYENSKSFIKTTESKIKNFIHNLQFPHKKISAEEDLKKATEQALKIYDKYLKFKNSSANKQGIEKRTTKSNQETITVFTDNGPVTIIPGIEIFAFQTNEYSLTNNYEGIFDDSLYYNVEIKKCSDIYYGDNPKVIVNGFSVNPETKEVKFISEQKRGTYHHLSSQFKIFVHQYADRQRINEINEKTN